jgi:hypothetical protein
LTANHAAGKTLSKRPGTSPILLLWAVSLAGFAQSQPPPAPRSSEPTVQSETGAVVAIGQRTLELQTFDLRQQKLVQHSFVLLTPSQAAGIHVGETVEVQFQMTATDRLVRKLSIRAAAPRVVTITPGGPSAPKPTPGTTDPVNLGNSNKPQAKAVEIKAVPLGSTVKLPPPVVKDIAHDVPKEECNRSSAEWPGLPVSMAVLDFRYPVEREEAHDIGSTGGGSGTAVADLVFARLEEKGEFALTRGDRRRLYRADFAGAARTGRLLGADAVLAGTFAPVDERTGVIDNSPTPRAYELRAGIVDTCTGQLLLSLTSITCPGGARPGITADPGACRHFGVTAKEATDPVAYAAAFSDAVKALLFPLELAPGSRLKAGDQLALHAWRLSKNASTYTLHTLQDEEIGRVTLTSIQGKTATGKFVGDFSARAGDTAELVPEQ